tara:strand:+ start:617 stop:1003 length:387 start_codon:yes stop_codon:yes gene_type:complete
MYQPKFPLKFSDIDGAYESIRDIKLNIKQNVLFLLKTSPGEWPGHPEIGVGLKHFLFENYPSRNLLAINKRIKDQFSKYLPFLEVESKIIDKDQYGNALTDYNQVKLVVKYSIAPINDADFVEVAIAE